MARQQDAEGEIPSEIPLLKNDYGITQIESLCMNCHKQGITRISIIQIPYFKEVLLESFSCELCGFKNTSVKSAGAIQEKGTKYTFRIEHEDDFQRQVVRSETATFKIEDLDLEMPASAGQLTNLESIFSKILTDLKNDQPERKTQNPALHDALTTVIHRLDQMLQLYSFPITVSLDDPSGNSFIEPSTSDKAAKYIRTDYIRTHDQNILLCLAVEDSSPTDQPHGHTASATDNSSELDIVDGQIYEIPASCPACTRPCTVNMRQVHIPHFKEVIIMATVCERCGYRTSDVKTGGAIPDLGKRVTLRVLRPEDLSRDILKSETCALISVELDLEVQPGTLGGRFTTVEGLLTHVRDQLRGQIFDVNSDDDEQRQGADRIRGGDSMSAEVQAKWNSFFEKLEQAIRAEIEFSIMLQDPLANSYVESLVDEGEDPQIMQEEYERTADEIEDLGLVGMKTEGYEDDGDQVGRGAE